MCPKNKEIDYSNFLTPKTSPLRKQQREQVSNILQQRASLESKDLQVGHLNLKRRPRNQLLVWSNLFILMATQPSHLLRGLSYFQPQI